MNLLSGNSDSSFALFFSAGTIEKVVDLLPCSPELHSSIVVVDRLPGRKIIGEHPPLAARFV